MALNKYCIRNVRDLAKDIRKFKGDPNKSDWGGTVFLIGAGCSRSARIPLGDEIVKCCLKHIVRVQSNNTKRFPTGKDFIPDDQAKGNKEALEALEWLCANNPNFNKWNGKPPDWGKLYNEIFELHFNTPEQYLEIISAVVKSGAGQINWSYLCLGELVKQGYIQSVLTANFDQLAQQGISYTGLAPVIVNGMESSNRISGQPLKPQLIHLHGSMNKYHPLNNWINPDKSEIQIEFRSGLLDLIKKAKILVAIGYAGCEEGVMKMLLQSAKEKPDNSIYWGIYSESVENESEYVRALLQTGNNKNCILRCDADNFFADIMKELALGVPSWMRDPIQHVNNIQIAPSINSDIQCIINDYSRRIRATEESKDKNSGSTENVQAAVATLRLQGKHKEALGLIKTIKDPSPELLLMIANSTYELGKDDPDTIGSALSSLVERQEKIKRLEEAVSTYRATLKVYDREQHPLQWASTQSNLGNALGLLGNLEKGTQRWEEAVLAFRAALEVYTREQTPMQWAISQNNLATTLRMLGFRTENIHSCEEAIIAFRAALEIYTHEQMPIQWAATEFGLGRALGLAGMYEKGTNRLEEAVSAYRAVLQVYTKEQMPLEWATTQFHIGVAFSYLGSRDQGTKYWEESVAAFHAALEVRTPETQPFDWSRTINSLGNALFFWGERERGTKHLEEALAVYRSALMVRTREKLPLQWATIQINIANTLRALGRREKDKKRLEEAISIYRKVLDVYNREQWPVEWALMQDNLGIALTLLGELEKGVQRLEEAISAHRLALEVRTRDHRPVDWAKTQDGLGNALRSLGKRKLEKGILTEAIKSYRAALEISSSRGLQFDWATTQNNLGKALNLLGECETGTKHLKEAVLAHSAALNAFNSMGIESRASRTKQMLEQVNALINKRKKKHE